MIFFFICEDRIMKKYLILSLFFLSGCATNYQPKSIIGNGGFEDIELAPNYFQVVFKGNDATSEEKASDFALLRVSDLMLERDCNTFKVVTHKQWAFWLCIFTTNTNN